MTINIIHLYRNILKHAIRFPSKKRLNIVKEIKLTFRENSKLEDKKKLEEAIKIGIDGLKQLSMYTSLRNTPGDWVINLTQEPMPKRRDKE